MKKFTEPDVHTTTLYLDRVLANTSCDSHGADQDVPCFEIRKGLRNGRAICNERAKRAGMNARISEAALTSRKRNPYYGQRK